MSISQKFDPLRIAFELRDQMASARRRTGLLLGAGSSMAAGLPGLDGLTRRVQAGLVTAERAEYDRIWSKLGTSANIEGILNRIRLIRELVSDSSEVVDGLSGDRARELDIAICQQIFKELKTIPSSGIEAHYSLASWIRHVQRDEPLEVFTTNYDLLLEYAFEAVGLPYFDGFVGVVAPFFAPQCVEAEGGRQNDRDLPPIAWTRIWKLHGSVSWQIKQDPFTGKPTIVRLGIVAPAPGTELVIYPTREKLAESRKLPFATFIDKFRKFLSTGETLLLVSGYSFRDEHINAVLTEGLRANTRTAISAFLYGKMAPEVLALAQAYRNFSVFARDSACIGGVHGGWILPVAALAPGEERPFWDEKANEFVLGDFKAFARFLGLFGGQQPRPLVAPAPAPVATPSSAP